MERPPILLVLKGLLLFGLISLPLVLVSCWPGDVELKPIFKEFSRFLLGDVDGITSVNLTSSIIPTLIVFGVIGTAVWSVINAIISLTFGSPKRDESRLKMMNMSLWRVPIF